MRLKHVNPDIKILALPDLEPIEPDAGGGFTVPDTYAPDLLAMPFWQVHDEPLVDSDSGGSEPRPAPSRKTTRSKTPPPLVRAEASVGGTQQA
jgi:hypothetical protein